MLAAETNRAQLLILEALSRSEPLTRAELEKHLRRRLVYRVFSDLCTDALAALVLANKIGVAAGGNYVLREAAITAPAARGFAEFGESAKTIRHRQPNKQP